jgi:hypothetical protein
MISPSRAKQIYSSLVFYGTANDGLAVSRFYDFMVPWYESLGYLPNKSLVSGQGFSGKWISFKHNNSKLAKQGFEAINNFELASVPDDSESPMYDYFISTSYMGDLDLSCTIISTNCAISNILGKCHDPLLQSLIETLKPSYGIGYLRELRKGPILYALGIGQGREIEEYSGAAYEEGVRHSHWGGAGMQKEIYREGVIRDIYPWNLLNNKHLDFPIDGIPFRQWIQGDRNRGSLTALTDECWLWEISEAAISGIRPILWNSGIIFNK